MIENSDLSSPSDRARERALDQEWKAISQLQSESLKQLREQTAALGETSTAAASLALRGFERAEARMAALEANLQDRLTSLSREMQSALAEVRQQSAVQTLQPVAPFPLDGVVRIHEDLRQEQGKREPVAPPAPLRTVAADTDARRNRQWLIGIGVVAATAVTVLGIQFERRMDAASARVTAAQGQAQAASDAATRQIAQTQAAADREIAGAREAAREAQTVAGVLAAPDLVRFNLVSPDSATNAYAQVLWSRSRGLVVSASRLSGVPAGHTYQTWLLTTADPVSAGSLTPDAEGRATLVADLPNVTRPVRGVVVTKERTPVPTAPSGDPVLVRPQPAASATETVAPPQP